MLQLAPRDDPYLGVTRAYGGDRQISERTAEAIDEEVLRIIQESHDEALRLLRKHRTELDRLANALVARETLDEAEILEVTGLPRAPELPGGKLPAEDTTARAAPRPA
jgi:cell division protease FtsH